MALLLLEARFAVPKLAVFRGALQAAFGFEQTGDGELWRRLFGAVVGGRHVRVHVKAVLEFTLGALRLDGVKVVQVTQLELLVFSTFALCSEIVMK